MTRQGDVDVLDGRFAAVAAGPLERLCTGAAWCEGPLWLHENEVVLWSDIPNNRILQWSETDGMRVWRDNVEFTNGRYREADGSVVHCSHGHRAITRTRFDDGFEPLPDEVVVDSYDGGRLNSPNDVVVKSDGTIWFTDPPYGILGSTEGYPAESEQNANYVFCYDPAKESLRAASHYVEEPNGLAFSADESVLYVSDTSAVRRPDGNHHIVAFDLTAANELIRPRVFTEVSSGVPDGFRLDENGWLYTSSEDGIQIFDEQARLLARIAVPETVSNLTFGGAGRNQLFITAGQSLYRIRLHTAGIQKP